jgi:hypothetical protein
VRRFNEKIWNWSLYDDSSTFRQNPPILPLRKAKREQDCRTRPGGAGGKESEHEKRVRKLQSELSARFAAARRYNHAVRWGNTSIISVAARLIPRQNGSATTLVMRFSALRTDLVSIFVRPVRLERKDSVKGTA